MTKVRRYAARRDEIESEIVAGLQLLFGAAVSIARSWDTVDLVIGFEGRTLLMEIKSPGGKLKKSQLEFLLHFQGEAYAVDSLQDAVNAVKGELEIPNPRYHLHQFYNRGVLYHQITAARFLLNEWWYEIDSSEYLPESKVRFT